MKLLGIFRTLMLINSFCLISPHATEHKAANGKSHGQIGSGLSQPNAHEALEEGKEEAERGEEVEKQETRRRQGENFETFFRHSWNAN